MFIDQLKARLKAHSFVPFTILTADGRSFQVPHEDFVSQFLSGRTIIVHAGDDSHVLLDGLMITSLEMVAPFETAF